MHEGVRAKTRWHRIRIICQNGVTCLLPTTCYPVEIVIYLSKCLLADRCELYSSANEKKTHFELQ